MKKLRLLILIIITGFVHSGFAQTTDVQSLLNKYLNLKDALVKSDANQASKSSGELLITIEKVGVSVLKPKEKKSFDKGEADMIKYTKIISTTSDIEKQRTAFAELSIATWKLVKDAESITQNIYYQYCPMKKSYWLSTEKEIKNPYYGSEMLTCGNVSDKKIK